MPVWLVAIATVLGSALLADLPASPRTGADDVLVFEASAFTSGAIVGLSDQAGRLSLTADAPSSPAYPDHPRFGVAESAARALRAPAVVRELEAAVDAPPGAESILEARGLLDGRWTEWREAADLEDLDGSTSVQLRVTLLAATDGASPRLRWATVRTTPAPIRVLDSGAANPPTARVWATRIGLVGKTTANGHVVGERDRFVALPSRRSLSARDRADYSVRITYRGKTVEAPIWDIGPWNVRDDYWNPNREQYGELPRWTPQAEAAFFTGYNDGRDGMGRFITLPASVDIADGTFWDDLGMTANDWVEVTFLWMDAPSPPPRAMPRIVPKIPPEVARTTQVRSASYNAPTPSNRLYLPLLMADANGWSTHWTIQNPLGAMVNGTMQLYAANGTPVVGGPFTLPPHGSRIVSPLDPQLRIPPGFVGSAVITASGPIAAVVNEDRPGVDRMAYEGFAGGAASVVAPIVFKEYNGWSTGIQVQNLGSAPTSVDVQYVDEAGEVAASETGSIVPMAAMTFYQPANPELPTGFAGSARIRSLDGQPLAVLVNEVRADGSAMAYPAASAGAERLEVPLLFKRYNGWDTGLQLFNLGAAPATVQVTYHTSAQPTSESMTIGGGKAMTLYQPANPRLPDGYVGSATVTAAPGTQLVGVVNEVRGDARSAMNYVVGPPSAPLLAIPLVTKGFEGWDSGIQVRNPGPAPAQVAVVFYSEAGSVIHRVDDTIPVGSAKTYYTPSIAQVPAGFRGSATVQSMNGQPLTAIVNEVASGVEAGGK